MIRDRTLKALSLLLGYPGAELQEAMPEIGGLLASESRLTTATRRALRPLVEALGQDDLYALQERYVDLFDRTRSLSLNLFEHVHGESRDRGGAMVNLLETYRAGGFEPTGWQLPDHLPMFLEYLATRPAPEAAELLAETAHILEVLRARLERRESPYAAVFASLLQLAGARPDSARVAELLAEPEVEPTDLAALDAVWEETEVTFGPDPNAGCPATRDLLARMDRPAPPITPPAAQ